MRGLGREEEDLEDTVSHLSIYLTGLDELYREQAAQLKQQVHRAEKATQELDEQGQGPHVPSTPWPLSKPKCKNVRQNWKNNEQEPHAPRIP